MAPFGKYLVALSKSFQEDRGAQQNAPPSKLPAAGRATSAKRKRLYVLYILNDVLYHVKFRLRDSSFAAKLEATLPALVRSASSFPDSPKHLKKIERLVDLWEENEYFAPSLLDKLRAAIEDGAHPADETQARSRETDSEHSSSAVPKAAPYIIPAMHGDSVSPWYDLPAGNWLPVLEPNSTRPMNPSMIKPLQLASGPAEKPLIAAVEKLLSDVDKIYTKDFNLDQATVDIGQMGEYVELDELGEAVIKDTYYGWSRSFCEKVRSKRRVGRGGKSGQLSDRSDRSSRSSSRSRSRSPPPRHDRTRGSSRDSSRPAFKRRRMSSAEPHDKDARASRSRSPSRSRDQRPRRDRSYSRSRSRSRSYEPGRSDSRSLPRAPDYAMAPHTAPLSGLPPRPLNNGFLPHNGPGRGGSHHVPPPPPPPHVPFGGMPFPGFPGAVPPPPPPNYHGQWPPPPPPMGNPHQGFYTDFAPPQTFAGGWAPPPGGPPPPQQAPSQTQNFGGYGRGGAGAFRGNSHGGGRGGGYGRGGWQ